MQPVETVGATAVEQIDRLLATAEQPLLLKGLCSHWPAVQAGRDSAAALCHYLQKFDRAQPVTAYQYDGQSGGRIFYNEDMSGFNFMPVQLPFKEFATRLQSFQAKAGCTGYYLGSTALDQWFSGFTSDNSLPLTLPFAHMKPLVSLWMGNPSRVAAHFDFPDNLAVCIAGHRNVTLFAPEQIENLYIGPLDFNPAGQAISMVDIKAPDFSRFPKFKQALDQALYAELEPGDAIFIPSMWWHAVEGLDQVNGLINYWWRNTPAFLGPPMNVLYHAILSLKSLPKRQRNGWKHLLDHYVFEHEQQDTGHIPRQRLGPQSEIDEAMAHKLRSMLLNKMNR